MTRYEYRYKKSTDLDSAYGGWAPAGSDPTKTTVTVEIKPLFPAVQYTFQVRARNSTGPGIQYLDIGPVGPVATAPTAAPSFSTTLGAIEGVPRILISYDELATAGNGGAAITGYEVQVTRVADPVDDDWEAWQTSAAGYGVFTALPTSGSPRTADNTALLPGTTYQYRVRAVNDADGNDTLAEEDERGPWSIISSKTTPAVGPIAPILALSGDVPVWVADVNSITLKWTAPADDLPNRVLGDGGSDITSYEIWVGSAMLTDSAADDDSDLVNELAALVPTITGVPGTSTEYTNSGLTSDQTYYYRVRARTAVGESPWSEEQSDMTEPSTMGSPATMVAPGVNATGSDIRVSWEAPTQGNSPIIRFDIQFQNAGPVVDADDPGVGAWADANILMAQPVATSHPHKGLEGGARYYYRIRAVNATGEGAWSPVNVDAAAGNVDPRAPGVPMLTATPAGKNEIFLQWTVPADNGNDIDDYDLQRWTQGVGDAAGIWDGAGADLLFTSEDNDTASTGTLFQDTGLVAGVTYFYRIRAENNTAEGAWSTLDTVTTVDASTAESATTGNDVPVRVDWTDFDMVTDGTQAEVGTGDDAQTITLRWGEPEDGGSDITGYEIQVWNGSTWAFKATPAAADTMYKDTGLTPGTLYHYVIRAMNSLGSGPWSDSISATASTAAPDVPVLTATATGRTTIVLEWTVPYNNGAAIIDYDLQRWNNVTNEWTGTDLHNGSDASTATLHTDGLGDPLASGTTYYYRINAANGADPADVSEWSAEDGSKQGAASATTEQAVPGVPTLPPIASSDTTPNQITVTWTSPADNGGSAITHYELQSWDGANRRWVAESTLPASAGTTANGTTTFTYDDKGLASGKTYYYRVRAMNAEGASAWAPFKPATTDPMKPGIPTLTATAISSTEIRLSWTVPSDGGSPITDYDLQKWGVTNNVGDWPDDNVDLLENATSTVTLHVDSAGLTAGEIYYYRIRAKNGTSETETGDWSSAVSARTHADVPESPTLAVGATGATSIELTWDAPESNGSPIIRYELEVWDTDSRSWQRIGGSLTVPVSRYTHRGLDSGTRYGYRLRAVNGAPANNGQSAWSTIFFPSTDAAQ